MTKPILYVDMDNVLVDFRSALVQISPNTLQEYSGRLDEIPGIFSLMSSIDGAIEVISILVERYEVYILSTSPWLNPTAWSDKLVWIQKNFGSAPHSILYKRLILSHHKNLSKGDYLIDDRGANGADAFDGELIKFGVHPFENWRTVTDYLLSR